MLVLSIIQIIASIVLCVVLIRSISTSILTIFSIRKQRKALEKLNNKWDTEQRICKLHKKG